MEKEHRDADGIVVSEAFWPKHYDGLRVRVLSPGYYYKKGVKEDEYSKKIVDSKTKELSGYFYPLVKWLFDKKRKEYNLDSSDLITVIPGSKSTTISPTLRVIGELLSKDTGIPCDLIIERTRQSSWSQRNGVSRFSDVSGSMTLKRRLLGNEKKILLLDDTRTTGMTALECAKMLTAAGAEDAILICLGTNTSKEEVDK